MEVTKVGIIRHFLLSHPRFLKGQSGYNGCFYTFMVLKKGQITITVIKPFLKIPTTLTKALSNK